MKQDKTVFMDKIIKKENFDANEYPGTQSTLLGKDFKNLTQQNEQIEELFKQSQIMKEMLNNLIDNRRKNKEEFERRLKAIDEQLERNEQLVKEGIEEKIQHIEALSLDQQQTEAIVDQIQSVRLDELKNKIDFQTKQTEIYQQYNKNNLEKCKLEREKDFVQLRKNFDKQIGQVQQNLDQANQERQNQHQEVKKQFQDFQRDRENQLNKSIKERIVEQTRTKKDFTKRLEQQENYIDNNYEKFQIELNHISNNLNKEMNHRLDQQTDFMENMGNVITTLQNTVEVLKKTQQIQQ